MEFLVVLAPYLIGVVGLWLAQRFKWAPTPVPAPVPAPVPLSPAPGPVMLPSVPFKTGNPAIDAMIQMFAPQLLALLQRELEEKFAELAKRILPPPDAPTVRAP